MTTANIRFPQLVQLPAEEIHEILRRLDMAVTLGATREFNSMHLSVIRPAPHNGGFYQDGIIQGHGYAVRVVVRDCEDKGFWGVVTHDDMKLYNNYDPAAEQEPFYLKEGRH